MSHFGHRTDIKQVPHLDDTTITLESLSEANIGLSVAPVPQRSLGDFPKDEIKVESVRLVPLRMQTFYRVVSATAVAISHCAHNVFQRYVSDALCSAFIATTCLAIIQMSRRWAQPWFNHWSYWILNLLPAMLFTIEISRPLQLLDALTSRDPQPTWPLREVHVIRFCLAYCAISLFNRPRRNAGRTVSQDDCELPTGFLMREGKWVWEQQHKLRSACYVALCMLVCNILSRIIAYCLGARVRLFTLFFAWGSGCLGQLGIQWQMTWLLRPVYDLTFWVCEEIWQRILW